jgi:hypothetical protein
MRGQLAVDGHLRGHRGSLERRKVGLLSFSGELYPSQLPSVDRSSSRLHWKDRVFGDSVSVWEVIHQIKSRE